MMVMWRGRIGIAAAPRHRRRVSACRRRVAPKHVCFAVTRAVQPFCDRVAAQHIRRRSSRQCARVLYRLRNAAQ